MKGSVKGVVLALDVGEARIGLARGELGRSFAFGRGFITRRTLSEDVAELKKRMVDEGAVCVVVGLPRHRDGRDSLQTTRVRRFAEALRDAGLDVVLEDERFTTRIATRSIAESGLRKTKRQDKGRVDEASAVLILESYLAKHLTLTL